MIYNNKRKKREQSSKYFFQLEKSKGQEKLWEEIKCEDGTYKFYIHSILNEQIKFYEKLFKTEGWDEERGLSVELCKGNTRRLREN